MREGESGREGELDRVSFRRERGRKRLREKENWGERERKREGELGRVRKK